MLKILLSFLGRVKARALADDSSSMVAILRGEVGRFGNWFGEYIGKSYK